MSILGCDCSAIGSEVLQCDNNGECKCKPGFTLAKCDECLPEFEGDKCEDCASTFYGYPDCKACECNGEGSKDQTCNAEGKCTCNDNVTGDKCDSCIEGHYMFPKCEGEKGSNKKTYRILTDFFLQIVNVPKKDQLTFNVTKMVCAHAKIMLKETNVLHAKKTTLAILHVKVCKCQFFW